MRLKKDLWVRKVGSRNNQSRWTLEMDGGLFATTPNWKMIKTGTGVYMNILSHGPIWAMSDVHLPISQWK